MTDQDKEEQETVDNLYWQQIEEDCFIDLTTELPQPEPAISCGMTHYYNKKNERIDFPIPIVSYSNMSVIQAPPKQGKSSVLSLLLSAFLSPTGSNQYTGDIRGHSRGGYVLHFDTEQARYDAQKTFLTAKDMNESNIDLDKYKTYALRKLGWSNRVSFIEWKVDSLIKNGETVDLIILDGYADLCKGINDEEAANELVELIMKWTDEYKCAVLGCIHTTGDSTKATGWLGSALEKKVQSMTLIKKDWDNNKTDVKCKESRSKMYAPFSIRLNKYRYPYVLGETFDEMPF